LIAPVRSRRSWRGKDFRRAVGLWPKPEMTPGGLGSGLPGYCGHWPVASTANQVPYPPVSAIEAISSVSRMSVSPIDRAARLAAIPAGASPANRRRFSHCCGISSDGERERSTHRPWPDRETSQAALHSDQSPLPPCLFSGDILVQPIEFARIGGRNRTDMVAQFHDFAGRVGRPEWQARTIRIAGDRKVYQVR
jgi:hypothetical protein